MPRRINEGDFMIGVCGESESTNALCDISEFLLAFLRMPESI